MVAPYRYISLDDEPAAHQVVRHLMQDHDDFDDAGSFYVPAKAKAAISEQRPDLLFLDIQMPHMSGLDFLRQLQDPPVTLLLTAHSHHALEGFDLGVRDYLLKPVSGERLAIALNRVRPLLDAGRGLAPDSSVAPLAFQCGYETRLVKAADIIAIDAEGAFARLVCQGETVLVSHGLKELEDRLCPLGFQRLHKSHMVNWVKVTSLTAQEASLRGGLTRPIGRAYRAKLKSMSINENNNAIYDDERKS